MTRQTASIYKRANRIIVCANAEVTDGYIIDHEPFVMMEEPVPAVDLGRAVSEALDRFRTGVPAPKSTDEFLSYFAALAGVDSYRTFMQGATHLTIEREAGMLSFMPMKNDGESFDSIEDETAVLAANAPNEAIGRRAIESLGQSR
ncbi:MAG: hypothetical protein ACR2O4_11885 [Hyphomicrobiaceae bacterium]